MAKELNCFRGQNPDWVLKFLGVGKKEKYFLRDDFCQIDCVGAVTKLVVLETDDGAVGRRIKTFIGEITFISEDGVRFRPYPLDVQRCCLMEGSSCCVAQRGETFGGE